MANMPDMFLKDMDGPFYMILLLCFVVPKIARISQQESHACLERPKGH